MAEMRKWLVVRRGGYVPVRKDAVEGRVQADWAYARSNRVAPRANASRFGVVSRAAP